MNLPESIAAWGTAGFFAALKRELLSPGALREALTRSLDSFGTIDDPIAVMMLGLEDLGESVEARIAVSYTVTEAVYDCPIGMTEQTAHELREMTVRIDRRTAEAGLFFRNEDT